MEFRLVEENKALSMERSHLSDLMANVQKMHSDIERSSENDRRRLESQIQLLENQRFVIGCVSLHLVAWTDVRPVKIHVTSSMRSDRTFGALLCNGRLKLKNYEARSMAR